MTTSLMPVLTGHTETADGAKTCIDLAFSTAMKAGQGKIYVTDGGLQTVIDPATGQRATRVSGATHTIEISASSLHFSGSHVYTDALDLQPGHQYSVLFEPGALSATGGLAFSGWIRYGQTQFTTANTAPPAETPKPVALTAPVLDVDSDKGVSNSDGITNDNTPTFGGTGAEAFAKIELFSGSEKIGETTAGADGKWTITASPLTSEGIHWITAKQINTAGGESPASPAFKLTLDSSAPTLAPVSSTIAHDGTFFLKFSDLIQIAGSVGDVAVYKDGTLLQTVKPGDAQWVVETDGTYEYSVLKLAGLADGAYRLHFGFSSPVNMIGIASTGLLQDDINFSVGATTLAAPLLDASSDTGLVGDSITSSAVLHGSGAQAGATITLYNVSGSDTLGTTQADASGNWTFTMDGDHFQGSYSVTVTQKDGSGSESAKSPALSLTIDSHVSVPSQPVLDLGGDTTTVDGVIHTPDTTPTLTGSGCEAGAAIALFDGSTLLATATAGSDGAWSITTAALAGGLHHFAVTQTDVAGNASGLSALTDLAIDVPPPAQLAAPLLAAASDSGSSDSDRITKVTTPTFSGTGALGDTTIKLYEGEVLLGQGTSNPDGTWSVAVDGSHGLSDGVHAISVVQVDGSGVASARSDSTSVTIDTVAPIVGGYTSTVALGSQFELWFSEPVKHDNFGSGDKATVTVGGITLALSLGSSGSWTDLATRDGHDTTIWHFVPNGLGTVDITLTGVQDVAGNVATLPLAHYAFTLPL